MWSMTAPQMLQRLCLWPTPRCEVNHPLKSCRVVSYMHVQLVRRLLRRCNIDQLTVDRSCRVPKNIACGVEIAGRLHDRRSPDTEHAAPGLYFAYVTRPAVGLVNPRSVIYEGSLAEILHGTARWVTADEYDRDVATLAVDGVCDEQSKQDGDNYSFIDWFEYELGSYERCLERASHVNGDAL